MDIEEIRNYKLSNEEEEELNDIEQKEMLPRQRYTTIELQDMELKRIEKQPEDYRLQEARLSFDDPYAISLLTRQSETLIKIHHIMAHRSPINGLAKSYIF